MKKRVFLPIAIITMIFLRSVVSQRVAEVSPSTKVFFLYTQKANLPDLAFQVSAVPLESASLLYAGFKSFQSAPVTVENILKAFSKAEFLIIGTHGFDGMFNTDDGITIDPRFTNVQPKMKLVYFGSCYFGKRKSEWQQVFPNAKLIGYEGLTTERTGWKYLFFQSPLDLMEL